MNLSRPQSIPRTGETELCRMGNLLDRHAHRPFYATEKVDGYSLSVGWVDGEFAASTRERIVPANEDSAIGRALRELCIWFVNDAILQGELVGPGIQGNRYGLDRHRFFAFDLIENGQIRGWAELKSFCSSLEIETVPLLAESIHLDRLAVDALTLSRSRLNPAMQREGAVFRPMQEAQDDFHGRVSFKVFNPAYPFHH